MDLEPSSKAIGFLQLFNGAVGSGRSELRKWESETAATRNGGIASAVQVASVLLASASDPWAVSFACFVRPGWLVAGYIEVREISLGTKLIQTIYNL